MRAALTQRHPAATDDGGARATDDLVYLGFRASGEGNWGADKQDFLYANEWK